ncbi:MAG: sn-glycerol-3-phosphate ABC transporter ATP-binding protein UgpC [Candidatus Gastranaerophilales bacterium]|nr:sn-glycerol-3-phosphate ABC transporter ATP-binding protein UgpC [Candidatus Gastranaerophilales bacterium]
MAGILVWVKMAKVEFKNVNKSYDKKTNTIENLNLEIKDKEFLVLVGPSGCGKSTILRMIAGLEDITKGELLIDDTVVNSMHPKDRDIAMVFQNYALYPHMTVKENMAFGLKMRKFKKDEIEKRVINAAKILDLEQYLERKPKQLSGGQRQRVALGRAMVRNPKVFLMDEPLSNLDAKLRVQMRSEIKKLHHDIDATIVYVTHDQVEALTMGDRIVILDKGIIQQIGTPEEVYNNPENIFTAGFVGSPAMNFFEAVLTNDNKIEILGQTIAPGDELLQIIKNHNKTEFVFAIRPEYFVENSPVTIEITPYLTELLGSEKLIHFSFKEQNICAKVSINFNVKENEKTVLGLDLNKVLLFDKITKSRLR